MTASVANANLVNAYALHDTADRAGVARWSVSALAIVVAHGALIAAGMAWVASAPPPGTMVPAIMVDLAPATSAPEPQQQDIAPGPEMQQAEEQAAPPPEPLERQVIQEQIPATPPQLKPEVVAPPEQKPEPTPPKPEPAKVTPEPKPEPAKPKPVHREVRKPSEHPPAPRTSAAPKADRRAELAAAARAGAAATAAALPAYRDLLAAHLQRYKQYPSGAKAAGEQGTAMLTFTVSRSGRVLSSRLARSSGHAALDAETMAMIQRAQPLPAFPHDLPQASMNFTVPVRFAIR